MHYNQTFGANPPNALNNGYGYGYNIYNPPHMNSDFYPHSIVGEGDVSCVTLPDGTCQFYFTPTSNWCPNTYPSYNMTNSHNPFVNPNVGTWFVRSITSPVPAVWNNALYQRHDARLPFQSLEYNRNMIDNGYQLKFHSDVWTSTTDIHYFYPCLRQIDYTLALPTRGCAAVQVDTPIATNTICHYEVICSKPCNANSTLVNTSVSAMSLDTNTKTSETIICRCASPIQLKRGSANKSLQRLQLLPSDGRKKRIKLERKKQKAYESKSKDVICECSPPPSVSRLVHNAYKRNDDNLNKSKQFSRCSCKETPIVQRNTNAKNEEEIWHPATNSLKDVFQWECSPSRSTENITQNVNESTSKDVNCQCSPMHSSEMVTQNVNKSKSKNAICNSSTHFSETVTQNVNKSKSKDEICPCSPSLSSERVTQNVIISKSKDVITQCTPTHSSHETLQNVDKSKSKDVICQCDSPPSSEKCMTTQDACKVSGCDLNKRVPSTRCCGKKIMVIQGEALLKAEPEMWCPITDSLKKVFRCGKGTSASARGSSYCD